MVVQVHANQKHLFAPIDSLAARQDGMVVAATSRVFGNEWDGGVTTMFEQHEKTSHFPCGCADVVFVGQESNMIGVACDDGNVVVMAITSVGQEGWKPLHLLAEHDNGVTCLSSSSAKPDTLASCSTDHTSRIWQFGDGAATCTRTLEGHHAPVYGIAHNDDGSTLASVGQDGRIRLWDLRANEAKAAASEATGSPLYCVCWGHDGNHVYTGGEDGDVLEYDVRAPAQAAQRLRGHGDSVRRVAIGESASGVAVLASAADDCCLMLRPLSMLSSGEMVQPHKDYVRGMCWGKGLVVSGSWDRTISHVEVK